MTAVPSLDQADAVVIGAGINGLVAAAELARAGWSVIVVERNDGIGGFIASEERTLPGYLHDSYSSWHPLFLSGAAYQTLGPDLHRHGLEYRNTDGWVTASLADDGRLTLAHRDPEITAKGFEHDADRDTYLADLRHFTDNLPSVASLLGSELRSVRQLRTLGRILRTNGRHRTERWLRDVASSGRGYCRRNYRGTEIDHLWAPWLLHAGLAPDHAAGGFMIPVLAATVHGVGLPIVAGGSGRFLDAFHTLLASHGVSIRLGCEVDQIVTDHGRATGVVVDGRVIHARRAVLASVTPTALYGHLLPDDAVDQRVKADAAAFRFGRGEMQIHVALSGPLSWPDERLAQVPLIHLSDGSDSTAIACAEAEAGLLPRRPTVVVGQQYVLDPSRVPDGAAALWLQLQEVPFTPRGDAAAELDVSSGWSPELASAYADRVLARIARHASDLPGKVLAIDVITPVDLSRHNPNAEFGDPYGGSAELDQNFLWRPLPSAARHATPVRDLWHIGASTHPGPGLGGGSGHLVAHTLAARRRGERGLTRNRAPRGGTK